MKEAAGEANMTVITIVLIAIVLAVGTVVINGIMTSMKRSSACSACGGYWKGGQCQISATNATTVPYDSCMDDIGDTDSAGDVR